MKKVIIYTDGASRGNPGEAGIGVVVTDDDGKKLVEVSKYLGHETNNVAEYYALIKGLQEGIELGAQEAEVFLDSELVVKQVKGEYRVKNEVLKLLFERVKRILQEYESITVKHVPREKNRDADKLANKAIDMHSLVTEDTT